MLLEREDRTGRITRVPGTEEANPPPSGCQPPFKGGTASSDFFDSPLLARGAGVPTFAAAPAPSVLTPTTPNGPLGHMERVLAPSEYGGEDLLVPYAIQHRDAGTAWFRSLKPDAVAEILDLAGEIGRLVHPDKNRALSQKEFYKKLYGAKLVEQARDRLVQIVGYNSNAIISLYHIWWAMTWTHNYIRTASSAERTQEDTHRIVSEKMGVSSSEAAEILLRRDVSAMVNGFFERAAKEHKGLVMWRTTEEALKGNDRHAKIYFDSVVGEAQPKDSGTRTNFEALSEAELQAVVAKLKREVGEPVETIEAKVTITEASFEVEEKK